VVLTLPDFHAPVGRARWGRRSTGPSRQRLRQRGEHLVVLPLPRRAREESAHRPPQRSRWARCAQPWVRRRDPLGAGVAGCRWWD